MVLYSICIFVSAFLLFLVQPMFTRLTMPLLGGSPAVWNTAMVFFQATLLLGYGYAYVLIKWLAVRQQLALHAIILFLPLLLLPISLPEGWFPPVEQNPILWLLGVLTVAVGLPFFVVSTSSPLLQHWFSTTRHAAASDPYFLYAASNVGSLLALLSYPIVFEPFLRIKDQSLLWAIGYGLLVMFTLRCTWQAWKSASTSEPSRPSLEAPQQNKGTKISVWRQLRWGILAFAPSSLLLSVTTYLSTAVAAVPLMWVVPLSLYLLTFALVFARRPPIRHAWIVRAWPYAVLPLVVMLATRATGPLALLITSHLTVFFLAAMICHGELAKDRPPVEHLAEFYLWLSIGGVLGGMFNALLAPVAFPFVIEYPLTLVLVCVLAPSNPSAESSKPIHAHDVLFPLALGGLSVALVSGLSSVDSLPEKARAALMFTIPALVCFSFSPRPLRFGLGIGALLLASALHVGQEGRPVHTERSFFGIDRVTTDPSRQYHWLFHGTTLHGMQSLDPARRRELLYNYYPTGPFGQVMAAMDPDVKKKGVAAVGLGTGSIVTYGHPGEKWTFYEIDPAVARIASDRRFFTYLSDTNLETRIVLGDGRLSLRSAPDHGYGLILLDAFSGATVPVHLITQQALELYLLKLAQDGILLFNISNRNLDLEPVLGNLAADADLVAISRHEAVVSNDELRRGKRPSHWVALAHTWGDLGDLVTDSRWKPARMEPSLGVWTDDFSSLLSVFHWR